LELIIFGSTGGTGRELVKQALDQGHRVTAYARSASKIEDLQHPNLEIMVGDVLDLFSVEKAIEGKDAVFITIGAAASRSNIREAGTRNIVNAMQKSGVKRLVCQSSLGVGDSRANLSFFTKQIIVDIFLRHAFADHERQEEVVRKCSLDWVIVRPPHLKDGPRTGNYNFGFAITDRQIKGWISRADVADFMLKQISDDSYLHKTPGVSY
jgi:putative NADH-flavin reductase